ncbi:MAG TPA: uroporphyrinogen decarboxylase family protein [Dehalococcoidales bacterium]|nr:uroporphyrinogen decarboxylase family protein [Dehalococcoidales bacterium]
MDINRPEYSSRSLDQLRKKIERKTGKTPEQLFAGREKRVRDAVELRVPDRVPVRLETHAFPARYAGIPISASFYQPLLWMKATRKTILDMEPDMYQATVGFNSGQVMDILDPKHLKWPGGTLPPNVSHQAIDQEYLKAGDYDLFLNDPADYSLRYIIPRAYGALAALARLPYLADIMYGVPNLTAVLAADDFQALGRTLVKAGQEQAKMSRISSGFDAEMASLGFPSGNHGGGAGGAPFDMMSDFYRGMHGSMLDMYRCPEKLLAACDRILQRRIASAGPIEAGQKGNPHLAFIGLHRGAEGFMSRQQFEKFYWPGLKKALLRTVELSIVPIIFCEGQFGDRLEYLLELPRGKAICLFDRTDMFRAKEILKNHLCIAGNVPPSLLQIASPQEVEDYCAKLIKVCGKGGGFILSAGSSIDDARPENLKAMMDAPQKHPVE